MSSNIFEQRAALNKNSQFSNFEGEVELIEEEETSTNPFEKRALERDKDKFLPGGSGSLLEKFGKSLSMQPTAKDLTEATNVGLKSTASGATFQQSQKIPGLKITEEEKEKFPELISIAGMAGEIAPISIFGKLAHLGQKATKAGIVGSATINLAAGTGFSSAKQLGEKGEVDIPEALKEGSIWMLLGGVGSYLAKSPKVNNFIESISSKFGPGGPFGPPPTGGGPTFSDLTPSEFKFFDKEVFPEVQKLFTEELENATNVRRQQLNQSYSQELANVRSKHLNELEAQQAEIEINKKYQEDLVEIQKQNDQLVKEFENQTQQIQEVKQREQAVQSALSNQIKEGRPLEGRVSPGDSNISVRPPENQFPNSAPRTAFNEISGTVFPSKRVGGETISDVVRAHSQIEYRFVNRAYDASRAANEGIEAIHPGLIENVQRSLAEINAIPQPSPPKIQLRNSLQSLLNRIAVIDEAGIVTGYQPVSNQILLDQAKDLRYFMDYEFANANPKGIFSPTLGQINEAVEFAAISSGNEQAYELSQEANRMYRDWSQQYNNDYVNPFRSRTNFDFQKNFNNALKIDEYMQIRPALDISPTGSIVDNQLKRAMVQENLGKFYEKPFTSGSTQQFNQALEEIRPALSNEEYRSLRNAYFENKKSSFRGKVLDKGKEPKTPKIEPKPPKPKEPRKIETVNLPKRKFLERDFPDIPQELQASVSKDMKVASDMLNKKPEDLMKLSTTPSGMRELKNSLQGSKKGDVLFDKIAKYRLRDIRYGKNIKPTVDSKKIFNNLNKGENYDMVAEILGEDAAAEMLDAAEKAANAKEPWIAETAKKYIKKFTIVKGLMAMGLL